MAYLRLALTYNVQTMCQGAGVCTARVRRAQIEDQMAAMDAVRPGRAWDRAQALSAQA